MRILKADRSYSRLQRLSEEQEQLKTELVQIQSMLLSLEELIAEEILRQAGDSAHSKTSTVDGELRHRGGKGRWERILQPAIILRQAPHQDGACATCPPTAPWSHDAVGRARRHLPSIVQRIVAIHGRPHTQCTFQDQ